MYFFAYPGFELFITPVKRAWVSIHLSHHVPLLDMVGQITSDSMGHDGTVLEHTRHATRRKRLPVDAHHDIPKGVHRMIDRLRLAHFVLLVVQELPDSICA